MECDKLNWHDVSCSLKQASEARMTKRIFPIEHHGPNLKPIANLHQEGLTCDVK